MTALGPYCSDREPVTIFNNEPRHLSVLERTYKSALADYEELFDQYIQSIDFWEDMRMQYGCNSQQAANASLLMQKSQERCEAAEDKVRDARAKRDCPHTHTEPAKGLIPGTDPFKVCVLCGADEDSFHASSVRESINEIP